MRRVGDDKKLKAMSLKVEMGFNMAGEIRGEVVDGFMEPRIFMGGAEVKGAELGKIDMAQQNSAISPMDLVNRVRHVHEGQTFKITMFDPFRGMKNPFINEFLKHMTVPALIAEVTTDPLVWDEQDVACYLIEYREIGKDVSARTWIRKRDGLVLQQQSAHLGYDMTLTRMPK
jgi:hypothetical protein